METTKELKEQVKLKSRFDASQIVDGVVINILFESYGLSDRFDAVKAIFPISYAGIGISRMSFLPEKQICIRNTSVIEQIKKHNDLVVPSGYEEFISSYNILKKELIGRKEYKLKQYIKRKYNYK